jgi:hypothetical protein
VQSRDTNLKASLQLKQLALPPNRFATLCHVLCSEHSRIGTGLVTVGFDTHPASDLHNRLTARQVSDVHKCVIE